MSITAHTQLYIGLMSGTSADGIDAALLGIDDSGCRLVAHSSLAFNVDLQREIHALCEPGDNEIERAGAMDTRLGELFAQTALSLLNECGLPPSRIRAIGSHGQTIRHRPPGSNSQAFSWQIGDANIIAARTGITTVADFRRRDIALGGQGAPLVPAFHRAVFSHPHINRAIINIGGIANITWLAANKNILGFDTGPGNSLMDGWIGRHLGVAYDAGGAWARSGRMNNALLDTLLQHPYFAQPLPKSTGREDFNPSWLMSQITAFTHLPAEDIQASLLALTVESIARDIELCANGQPGVEVYICGGGALNGFLMEQLSARLQPYLVATTQTLGIDPEWVEAATFAWLAHQTMEGLPSNLPSVTGARESVVLGGIYPA